ncbi:MAG: DNA polymerase III subunit delta [Actinobacteria bacterium]|uniref:DNA-directed DNA polymerase n=1 Tax=freshwater metagenome TaxID=449393 RepID=A0A6J6PXV4_9ZZZZ|nr:DNA polymerase III subunit delta [Actinomycetota bacterium]
MGITLLQGGEALLADRAISEVIAKFKGATVSIFDSSELELGGITDALAPSLFGDARIIVIKEIQDLPAELGEEITAYLEAQDESVELVLWHKGGVKGKALLEKIKKVKPTVVACDVIKKDGEKSDFIRAEFKRLGRTISTEAVQALIDALGSDLRELGGACSQLAADVVGGKMIDETDVLKFQNGRIETTGFDVADAALDGKRDTALIALRNALATGTDPVLITSALAGSLRTLAKVSGASRGVKSFDLAGPLGLAPWQIDKARRQLSKWTPATLAGAVVAVAQADADIKGAAVDPIHSLERAIIAITSRV